MASVKSILKKHLTFSHAALQPWKCEEIAKNGFFKKERKKNKSSNALSGAEAWFLVLCFTEKLELL